MIPLPWPFVALIFWAVVMSFEALHVIATARWVRGVPPGTVLGSLTAPGPHSLRKEALSVDNSDACNAAAPGRTVQGFRSAPDSSVGR